MLAKKAFNDPKIRRSTTVLYKKKYRGTGTKKVPRYFCTRYCPPMVIGDAEDKWDNNSIMKAAGFERWLSKTNTSFLIIIAYEEIFNKTAAFFRVLQNKLMDIAFFCAQIRDTIDYVERQRQEFDSFYYRFEQKCATHHHTDTGDMRQIKETFYNILDDIIVQLKSRFENFSYLFFLGLVDCLKFSEMAQEFNDTKLQSLSEKYAKFFDCIKLKAELIGLYSSQTDRNECKTPAQLLSFLYQNDLIQTVPEATKLLKLVHTVPATTPSVKRSFSASKRIKTYNRN